MIALLRASSRVVVLPLLLVVGWGTSQAWAIDIDAFQVGGFYASAPPDNAVFFQNYFVGHGTVATTTSPERRSFFLFDVPPLLPGEVIVDTTLSIYLPTEFSVPANFTGGIEVFLATSTPVPAEVILDPAFYAVPPEDIFATFGDGVPYGDLVFTLADPPTGPFPLEMVMPLSPDAVDDITASAGGSFVISGKMESYDPAPGALDEIIFSLSDVVTGGVKTDLPYPFLSITTAFVPEPNSFALALMGIAFSALARRRRLA